MAVRDAANLPLGPKHQCLAFALEDVVADELRLHYCAGSIVDDERAVWRKPRDEEDGRRTAAQREANFREAELRVEVCRKLVHAKGGRMQALEEEAVSQEGTTLDHV